MVAVDDEAGVLGDRRRDCLAHAPIGSEQAEADRLVGVGHAPFMAKAGAPRNGAPG